MTPEQMLRDFHQSKAIHGGLMPKTPTMFMTPLRIVHLRQELLAEEVAELDEAVATWDILKVADALADIVYVAVGTAITYGIPFDDVFCAVHDSNMTKDNTPDEAKLVKGPDYHPPDVAGILRAHGWAGE